MEGTIGFDYGVKEKSRYGGYERSKKSNIAGAAKECAGLGNPCMNKAETMPNGAGNITLDWAETIYSCIESLKKQYPGVNFEISGRADGISTESLAISSGNGIHMIIAPEFFQGMLMNPESFTKGAEFIQKVLKQLFGTASKFTNSGGNVTGMGAVIDAKGKAAIWTMQESPPEDSRLKKFFEMMRENNKPNTYKQKDGRTVIELKTKDGVIKITFVKRLGYSTGSDVARLARLMTVGNVRAFIGGLEAYMNQVRSDRFLDKAEVGRAVAMMKGVIMRAGVKVKNLQSESILELVRKNSLKAKKIAKAAQISRELKQKRTERKSREHFQKVDDLLPEEYYKEDANIDDWSSEPDTDALAMEIATAEMGSVNVAGAGGATEGTVVVADAGSVDITV